VADKDRPLTRQIYWLLRNVTIVATRIRNIAIPAAAAAAETLNAISATPACFLLTDVA